MAVAVVDDPQYEKSLVTAREKENRAKRLRTIRGNIPSGKALGMPMFARRLHGSGFRVRLFG